MSEETKPTIQQHRRLAIDLFNHVWTLLDKPDRTREENDDMIHAAHASRYHWGIVGAAVNLARGEWQVSRVYSVLKMPEPALYHARRCLDICLESHIGDFDLAFGYEALARASAIAGKTSDVEKYIAMAKQAGENITEQDDKELLFSDLKSIPG
ncbi:MAG: hypothetical protein HY023_13045 [Chloroflexi bacterium]|nr:hypothetical protein [Chloroflexota bacterium]